MEETITFLHRRNFYEIIRPMTNEDYQYQLLVFLTKRGHCMCRPCDTEDDPLSYWLLGFDTPDVARTCAQSLYSDRFAYWIAMYDNGESMGALINNIPCYMPVNVDDSQIRAPAPYGG